MLSASDRITLIKEIAARLSREDWPLIDLTLRQFSLPTYDNWHGGILAYVIEMIEGAKDDVLLDLATHLGYDLSARTSLEASFWQRGALRLFITHLASQRKAAGDIQENLSLYHITSFVAHKDIEPTREWQSEIELALNTANALLALLHPGFKNSNWTDQETGFALGRGLLVITVRFGQDPYGFLGKAQAVEGIGKDSASLSLEIFDLLRKHKQTRTAMAEALMQGFEESASFADAKRNLRFIENNDYWDSRFSDRLRSAIVSNEQNSKAFGVPERVEDLIRKREGTEEIPQEGS